ncbi:MAG: LON peptidase substrate-binding domain-containing protein [Rhodospirillales bacterium]|nr:LON peptidase substrate-binding domain-containing protein [Rhodospirillales bacterium]
MTPPDAAGELPDAFPVFPLTGALLLPRGRLPLNIFEPRYKAMVDDALGERRLMAMIQPDPTVANKGDGPGLYAVGCLGRISSFAETEDDRYLITLTGIARFRVVQELPVHRGYRRVRADWRRFAASDLAPPASGGYERAALVAALRGFFTRRGIRVDWEAVEQMSDDGLLTTLAMVCPFAPAEKQALLEAPDATALARDLLALLLIGAHGPAGDEAEEPGKPS